MQISLPDIKRLVEIDPSYLKEALAAILYHAGKISENEACDITGTTRREFEEILPKFGFSVLSDEKEQIDIETEVTTIQKDKELSKWALIAEKRHQNSPLNGHSEDLIKFVKEFREDFVFKHDFNNDE
jgi:broad-specificity NMP kinase